MRGTVKNYFTDRGFGFIRPDDGSADYFFHISGIVDRRDLQTAARLVP